MAPARAPRRPIIPNRSRGRSAVRAISISNGGTPISAKVRSRNGSSPRTLKNVTDLPPRRRGSSGRSPRRSAPCRASMNITSSAVPHFGQTSLCSTSRDSSRTAVRSQPSTLGLRQRRRHGRRRGRPLHRHDRFQRVVAEAIGFALKGRRVRLGRQPVEDPPLPGECGQPVDKFDRFLALHGRDDRADRRRRRRFAGFHFGFAEQVARPPQLQQLPVGLAHRAFVARRVVASPSACVSGTNTRATPSICWIAPSIHGVPVR